MLNTNNKSYIVGDSSFRDWSYISKQSRNYLFNKLNTSSKIHAKINEGPFNAFSSIFFLLKHEHVMIEKLL